MQSLGDRFWRDDSGFIISAELVIVLTIGVIGLVVGLSNVQSALVYELNDIARAFSFLNQSYHVNGFWGCKGVFSSGSVYFDNHVGMTCLGIGVTGGHGNIVGGGAYGPGYPGYGSTVVVGPKVIEQTTTVVTPPTPVPVRPAPTPVVTNLCPPTPVVVPNPCDPCETPSTVITPIHPIPGSPAVIPPPGVNLPVPNVPMVVPPSTTVAPTPAPAEVTIEKGKKRKAKEAEKKKKKTQKDEEEDDDDDDENED